VQDDGPDSTGPRIALCNSRELVQGGPGVPFDVRYAGQTCRAFAVRYEGRVHAYLNRCTHVAVELDWEPGRFFDHTGNWLVCQAHGAAYSPATGYCAGGPCRGGLVKIQLSEADGVVHWHTAYNLQPVEF
jgi:nitrite reductase/ring-hydroxylating ferredoxin subunit